MLLVGLLVLLVNLPLLHSTWVDRRVQGSGIDVTATVVDDRVVAGQEYWVSFTFPEDVDPDQKAWDAQVDEEAYDDAVASGQIRVRVLDGDPSAYRAEGAVQSRVPLVITLVADLILAGQTTEPQRGDLIREGPREFEVLEWRYSDPYRQTFRITTKAVG